MSTVMFFFAFLAVSQVSAAKFDVASVKLNPKPPDGTVTGTVRVLPGGRISALAATPKYLIQRAYGMRPDQIAMHLHGRKLNTMTLRRKATKTQRRINCWR